MEIGSGEFFHPAFGGGAEVEPGVVEAVGLVPKGGGAALAAVGHDVTAFDELGQGVVLLWSAN